jgi:hypothetical protein
MTLSGPDPVAMLGACVRRGLAPTGTPEGITIDREPVAVTDDWLSRGLARAQRTVHATFAGYPNLITVHKRALLYVGLPAVELEPRVLVDSLSHIPFELASFAPLHGEWQDGSLDEEYTPPSFSDGHAPLGWGCAFRGAGHGRLVSRRWLEFGPWRTLRGPVDTTFVQFHDLAADARTALEQARPGHDRMGISERGGFIQTGFVFSRDLDGLYLPAERKIEVVVHGREVGQLEMLEWCAARRDQAFGPERPVDAVAFVFPDEAAARRHVHELWLRELECWTIRGAGKVRLDLQHAPTPAPPPWV